MREVSARRSSSSVGGLSVFCRCTAEGLALQTFLRPNWHPSALSKPFNTATQRPRSKTWVGGTPEWITISVLGLTFVTALLQSVVHRGCRRQDSASGQVARGLSAKVGFLRRRFIGVLQMLRGEVAGVLRRSEGKDNEGVDLSNQRTTHRASVIGLKIL